MSHHTSEAGGVTQTLSRPGPNRDTLMEVKSGYTLICSLRCHKEKFVCDLGLGRVSVWSLETLYTLKFVCVARMLYGGRTGLWR